MRSMARPPVRKRPWSKLKARVEGLWAPELKMAIHCNVFRKTCKHFTFDEPRHWIILNGRIIWDFPGPFLRPDPVRGAPLQYWEEAYGWSSSLPKPSVPSFLMRQYLDRPPARLMEPFDDPWELLDILRAADRRLGREALDEWGNGLEDQHPAKAVLSTRYNKSQEKHE